MNTHSYIWIFKVYGSSVNFYDATEDEIFFSGRPQPPNQPCARVSQIHLPSGALKENPGGITRRAGEGTPHWPPSIVSTETMSKLTVSQYYDLFL